MTLSIRSRVLMAAMSVTAVMLALACSLIYGLLRDGMVRQLNQKLLVAAQGLAQGFDSSNEGVQFEWDGVRIEPSIIFRAWDETGKVVAESEAPTKLPSELPENLKNDLPEGSSRTGQVKLSSGEDSRIVLLEFVPNWEDDEAENPEVALSSLEAPLPKQSSRHVTLAAATSLSEIESVLAIARWRMLAVFGAAVLVSLLILWPLTGIIVRPINEIAERVKQLDAGRLSDRIDIECCPQELLPITDRLNEFMLRLEQAFQRERETAANIAHELRTPLAGLIATIQLAEAKLRSDEFYRKTLADCRMMSGELHLLVERVLLLAHLDAGKISLARDSIDVRELLRSLWQEVSSNSSESKWNVEWKVENARHIVSDASYLRQIIRNLMANAIDHGSCMHPIRIAASSRGKELEISIANRNDDLTEADLPRLKERFFQLDSNRTRTGRNAGIGLAICNELARLLGGRLELRLQAAQQFCAALILP